MKKVKIITFILMVILVIMIAFFGIYTNVQNRMENQVKDYSYAMDLKGSRNIRLSVSEEKKTIIKDSEGKEVEDSENLTDEEITEKGYTKEEVAYNSDEVKNKDNYINTKKILSKRLEKLGVNNYIIKLDEENGDIIIELSENENTDAILSNLVTVGKFEIVDSQTQEVLMDNSDIKLSNVMYGANNTGTTAGTMVYLNIEFTQEGSKKLEDISTKYVKVDNESTDNQSSENENQADTNETENTTSDQTEETENKEETKQIIMKIDDEEIMTTDFEEPIKTGKLQLSVGQTATDAETVQGNVKKASAMATVLDTGNLPLKYEIEGNEYIMSDIADGQIQIIEYIILSIVALALIILIIRYKTLGIIGMFSYVGLMSLFLLVIRYANVVISLEGIIAIILVLILNYIFVNKLLSKINKQESKDIKEANKETYKEFFIRIIPICITVITFCFVNWVPISSFGMIMFWGIALIALYNYIITKNILRIKAEK